MSYKFKYGSKEIIVPTSEELKNHSHAWANITAKPTTFAPSAHNQDWGTITGKPSTFVPSNHGHAYDTWLGSQYSAIGWLGFYNAYGGSRKGWIGHSGNPSLYIVNESDNNIYLRTNSGELRMYSTAFDSSFCLRTTLNTFWFAQSISVPSLINRSKEEYKTNIVEYMNACDIVRESKVYEYNLREELENNIVNKHYGFIIEREAPKELINGDGIDIYSLASINWQATKELIAVIDNINEEIEKLKKENMELRKMINSEF